MSFSRVEVDPSRARMMVDCKDLPDAFADLRHPECRRAVLDHLRQTLRVESLILAHYAERQYGAPSLAILDRIAALLALLDRMGTRAPAPRFPHLPRRRVEAMCRGCPHNPQRLFPRLREALAADFRTFHERFLTAAQALERYRVSGCDSCTTATRADLLFLYQRTEDFGEWVLTEASEGRLHER